jgi:hypothetical protein
MYPGAGVLKSTRTPEIEREREREREREATFLGHNQDTGTVILL